MTQIQNNQVQPPKEKVDENIKEKLDKIAKWTEVDVVMKILCDKLELKAPINNKEFVDAFNKLRLESLDAQRELGEKYMLTSGDVPKIKRPRKAKV